MPSKTNECVTIDENLLAVFENLLRGMVSSAIRGEPEPYRAFRAKMEKVADLDDPAMTVQQLAVKAEVALNFLQHHSARTGEFFQTHIAELREVIELLVGALTGLAVARPDEARRLCEISRQIHAAANGAQVRQAKLDMVQCIDGIRKTAERGVGGESEAAARDTVTSLPTRAAAEAALVQACAAENPSSAVVILLDRLKFYNQRYGREVGDKTLRFFSDFLRGSMGGEFSLFRWTGPALLMICPGPPHQVQHEVRKVLEPRLQFECESGSRHMLLSVDAVWSVLPMMVDPRLLINKIDGFTST